MNQEILKRLDALAEKLGVTAQYLWAVLVRQARVQAVTDGCLIIVAAIVAYALFRWWKSCVERTGGDVIESSAGEFLGLVFATCGTVVLVGFAIKAAIEIPGLLLNPQYFALQQILQALK